jgi:hypothetical protein
VDNRTLRWGLDRTSSFSPESGRMEAAMGVNCSH